MAAAAFYEIRTLPDGRHAFRLRSKTSVPLVSGEPFDSEADARASIDAFRRSCLHDAAYQRHDTGDGGCRFTVHDPATGMQLASSERFVSTALMEANIKLTQLAGLAGQVAPRAPARASAL